MSYKGKEIGDTLNILLNKVINNKLINDKNELLKYCLNNIKKEGIYKWIHIMNKIKIKF